MANDRTLRFPSLPELDYLQAIGLQVYSLIASLYCHLDAITTSHSFHSTCIKDLLIPGGLCLLESSSVVSEGPCLPATQSECPIVPARPPPQLWMVRLLVMVCLRLECMGKVTMGHLTWEENFMGCKDGNWTTIAMPFIYIESVHFAKKPWLKVLFADLLWEKNTVPAEKKQAEKCTSIAIIGCHHKMGFLSQNLVSPFPYVGFSLRLPALMDLYIHPLYIIVNKILSSILNSPAPIHPLYHSLSTLSTVGLTCHFI
jgi:hypothetical protein